MRQCQVVHGARVGLALALGTGAGCTLGPSTGVVDAVPHERNGDVTEAAAAGVAGSTDGSGWLARVAAPQGAAESVCTVAPIAPAEGADLTAGATLIWSGDCAGYRVEVSSDPSFPAHAVYVFGRIADAAADNAFSVNPTIWSSIGRRFTTAGYWRVVGGLGGEIVASDTRSFFTTLVPLPPPPAPAADCTVALESPEDGATIDAPPTLIWSTGCTGAYLELSTDPSFPVEDSYVFGAVGGGSYPMGDALWGALEGRFVDGGYWRVTAGSAGGPVPSDVRSFNQAPYGEVEDPLGPVAWTELSGQAGAWLGTSVGSAGDVNGDGYGDVVGGAAQWDGGQTNEGAAFLYLGSPAGLEASPAWAAEGGESEARLGTSVAPAGDVNGDGYGDVVVGAPNLDGALTNEGAAFLFLGAPGGPAASPDWVAQGGQAAAGFGSSVAPAGDVNGDGYDDVVVGAPNWDGGLADGGAAFLFLGGPGGLSGIAWSAEGDMASAFFGGSVATAGDVDGDGFADVVVGAPTWSNGQTQEGAAFVYRGSASGLALTPDWTAESDDSYSSFGASVASAGDVDGDGYSDVVIGASTWTSGQAFEGAAFLYLGSAVGLGATSSWSAEADVGGAFFGTSVASAGDVNGDGRSDVVIGAPEWSGGQTSEGASFLYLGAAGGLGAAVWAAEADQDGARFGASVASAGNVDGDDYDDVIVGAPGWDGAEVDEGAAFGFLGMGGAGPVDSDGDGFSPPDDCDDADPAVHPGAEEICDGVDQDCDDAPDDGFDADGDGWTTCAGDCDDGVPAVHPGAEDGCDGVDADCDGADVAHPGTEEGCPALSCLDALATWEAAPDGPYWVDPLGTGAVPVHCDMAGGGWTLVYRATNDGVTIENGVVNGPEAIGAAPITPSTPGHNKLADTVINSLRSGTVSNDMKVVVSVDGGVLGVSYHRSACTLQSGTLLAATDICNQSTTTGPEATDWVQSGHWGSLSRWYVDGAIGYIWPYTHVGPVATGVDHGVSLPDPYCTYYDARPCGVPTAFEIWAY